MPVIWRVPKNPGAGEFSEASKFTGSGKGSFRDFDFWQGHEIFSRSSIKRKQGERSGGAQAETRSD